MRRRELLTGVLAGLWLSSEEYTEHMIFKDGKPSGFYRSYVRDVQRVITESVANEFGAMALIKTKTGRRRERGCRACPRKRTRRFVWRRRHAKVFPGILAQRLDIWLCYSRSS